MKILYQTSIRFLVAFFLLINTNSYAQSIDLSAYELESMTTIAAIPNDLSGVTYNALTNTLFMVQNGDPNVYETDLTGNILRTIDLRNFEDTEGIVHISGTRFAVVEERRGNVVFFDIFSSTNSVNYNNATDIVEMPDALGPWGFNNGLEGVTYHPLTNKIVTIKEKNQKGYYAFSMPTSFPVALSIADTDIVCNVTQNPFGLSDLAGMHHLGLSGATDPTTGTHTLLLSHESRALVEADANCNEISRLSLSNINQAEGVTMDNNGTLYIVAEPNFLYIFNSSTYCPLELSISDVPITDGIYQADETISSTGEVAPGTNVGFKAGDLIILEEGFSVEPQAEFAGEIEECGGN